VEFYDRCATASTDAFVAGKWCDRDSNESDVNMEHRKWSNFVSNTGFDCVGLFNHCCQPKWSSGHFLSGERTFTRHNILLACERDECGGNKCVVQCAKFYDADTAFSTNTCFTFQWRNRFGNESNVDLERRYWCNIISNSSFDKRNVLDDRC
jgi:hypothetical protein